MKKKFKLGIIGAGFMASSVIKSIIDSKILLGKNIIVSATSEKSFEKVKKFSVYTTCDNLYLSNNSEFVLFAVKPQQFSVVAQEIKSSKANKFISIMAGVKKDKIKSYFNDAKVARVMPNTPCSLSCGAMGADLSDFDGKDFDFISSILSCMGKVVFIEENKFGIVTGVSGSSPAYFYLFAKGLIDCAVKKGLSEEDAKTLVVNTMIGSGKMILENQDKSLDELIDSVCSKGGTTIEAIKVFKENKLSDITKKAVNACVNRSKELEKL